MNFRLNFGKIEIQLNRNKNTRKLSREQSYIEGDEIKDKGWDERITRQALIDALLFTAESHWCQHRGALLWTHRLKKILVYPLLAW